MVRPLSENERNSVGALLLESQSETGASIGAATGFTVSGPGNERLLITNRHVVRGRDQLTGDYLPPGHPPHSLRVLFRKPFVSQTFEMVVPLFHDATGAALWREHADLGAQVDVVAVPLPPEAVQVNPFDFELAPSAPSSSRPDVDRKLELDVGLEVIVIGYPFGLSTDRNQPLWVRGLTASHPSDDYGQLPRFLIDSRTRGGQSGSPVFYYTPHGVWRDTSGEVVDDRQPGLMFLGVYSGRVNAESDLGFVWRASVLPEVISGVSPAVDIYGNPLID